jgi:hypothetical protein
MMTAAAAAAIDSSSAVVFDWTINVGNVLTLVTLIGGGAWWLVSFHYDLKSLRTEVATLRDVLNGLKDVLATLGRHEERFVAQDKRIDRVEQEIADLRRGEGFKLPLLHYRGPEPGE